MINVINILAIFAAFSAQSHNDSAAVQNQPLAAAEKPVADKAETEQNAGGFDDPFFSQDADIKDTHADTKWQDEQALAKQVQQFVQKKSLLKQYRALFKHKFFKLTLKARGLASVQQVNDTTDDGFAFSQVRLVMRGKLDQGFFYKGQFDVSRSPALVDAILGYEAFPFLKLSIGRMKPAFSREYLTSRSRIDFADRAQVVQVLAPARSQGLQVSGSLLGEGLEYTFGAFDAAAMQQFDFACGLLYSGRLVLNPLRTRLMQQSLNLSLGFSGSYGRSEAKDFSEHQSLRELADWSGERLVLGTDGQFKIAGLRLVWEYIYGRLRSSGAGQNWVQVNGGYASLIYALIPDVLEMMLRYDALQTSLDPMLSQFAIVGLRVYATDFFRVQLNYAWGPQQGRNESWSPNQLRAAFQFDL